MLAENILWYELWLLEWTTTAHQTAGKTTKKIGWRHPTTRRKWLEGHGWMLRAQDRLEWRRLKEAYIQKWINNKLRWIIAVCYGSISTRTTILIMMMVMMVRVPIICYFLHLTDTVSFYAPILPVEVYAAGRLALSIQVWKLILIQ